MKKRIEWTSGARIDVRRIDRETALRLLRALDRFLECGKGDLRFLSPPRTVRRLRVGEYRIIFVPLEPDGIHVISVKHRSQAYR